MRGLVGEGWRESERWSRRGRDVRLGIRTEREGAMVMDDEGDLLQDRESDSNQRRGTEGTQKKCLTDEATREEDPKRSEHGGEAGGGHTVGVVEVTSAMIVQQPMHRLRRP